MSPPAAGDRTYDYLSLVGSNGYYWSSSLATNNPFFAYSLYFYSKVPIEGGTAISHGGAVREKSEGKGLSQVAITRLFRSRGFNTLCYAVESRSD